jgi:hypothetical protein
MKSLGPAVPELIILPVYSALPSEMQVGVLPCASLTVEAAEHAQVACIRWLPVRSASAAGFLQEDALPFSG